MTSPPTPRRRRGRRAAIALLLASIAFVASAVGLAPEALRQHRWRRLRELAGDATLEMGTPEERREIADLIALLCPPPDPAALIQGGTGPTLSVDPAPWSGRLAWLAEPGGGKFVLYFEPGPAGGFSVIAFDASGQFEERVDGPPDGYASWEDAVQLVEDETTGRSAFSVTRGWTGGRADQQQLAIWLDGGRLVVAESAFGGLARFAVELDDPSCLWLIRHPADVDDLERFRIAELAPGAFWGDHHANTWLGR